MKSYLFSRPLTNSIRVVLLLAMLLLNFGYGGTDVAYAAPPIHDDFDSAKLITGIEYHDPPNNLSVVDTREATPNNAVPNSVVGDPTDFLCEIETGGTRNTMAGFASVWYKYTPPERQVLSLDAIGTEYDHYLAVWTGTQGNLELVACSDETFSGYSELSFEALAGITYYVEIAEFNDGQPADGFGGDLFFNAYITNTNVEIGGVLRGRYYVPETNRLQRNFINLNSGPVEITNVANQLITSERVIYTVNEIPTSFTEMMGLPNNQLSTKYWFPWYNNRDLDTQLRFGNVSETQAATVRVYIGGAEMTGCTAVPAMTYPYVLGPGKSVRVSCPRVNSGPVKIDSGTVPIVAAERVVYVVNGVHVSFSEMMGLPHNQLSTIYWMPMYNNKVLDTQLRFGNVSQTQTATVRVYIGTNEMINCSSSPVMTYPYVLGPGKSVRVNCSGVNNGPVKIDSGTVPIVAAERLIYKVGGNPTSFSEMMGLPDGLMDTKYWFPWYNNKDLDTQLRLALP